MARQEKYKIVFSDINPKIEKSELYSKKCYLGVSLNNEFFNGKHLALLLKWISKKFPCCIVVIGDYLNRYNERMLNSEISEKEAIRLSLLKGDLLEQKFKYILAQEKIDNIRVKRWLDFVDLASVKGFLSDISEELKKNRAANELITFSVNQFLLRNHFISEIVASGDKHEHSYSYILEELSVFAHLINEGYLVQVYPGTQLEILKRVANDDILLKSCNLNKGFYVDLSVKKKK